MVESPAGITERSSSVSAVRARELLDAVLDGRYRVGAKLAEGGMGCVYRALDLHEQRLVAVKILRPEVAANPQLRQRFLNEAHATMSVNHEHVIEILAIGELEDGAAYYVMELVDGVAIDECGLELDPAAIVAVALQLCAGLGAAHDKGVIHRDLKPENVLVEVRDDGSLHCTLIDFGIAKLPLGALTRPGQVLGTPAYLAPEQARAGGDIGPRADIYALGVVLYELIAGRLPFVGDDPVRLVLAHQFEPPPPLDTLAHCPPQLARAVMRCLRKDPEERYASMAELAADLAALSYDSDLPPGSIDEPVDSTSPRVDSAVLFEDPGLDYGKTVLFNRRNSPISVSDLVGVTTRIPTPPDPEPWAPPPSSPAAVAPAAPAGARRRGAAIAVVCLLVALALALATWP